MTSLTNKIMYRLFKIKPTVFYSSASYSSKQKTHYEVLGVSPNATFSEIKEAFYELSKQYHPDKDPRPNAKERFQQISHAYEVLSNQAARRQYDMRIKTLRKPQMHTKKKTQESANTSEHEYFTHGMDFNFDVWTQEHYRKVMRSNIRKKQTHSEFVAMRRQGPRESYPYTAVILLTLILVLGMFLEIYRSNSEDVVKINKNKADGESESLESK